MIHSVRCQLVVVSSERWSSVSVQAIIASSKHCSHVKARIIVLEQRGVSLQRSLPVLQPRRSRQELPSETIRGASYPLRSGIILCVPSITPSAVIFAGNLQ